MKALLQMLQRYRRSSLWVNLCLARAEALEKALEQTGQTCRWCCCCWALDDDDDDVALAVPPPDTALGGDPGAMELGVRGLGGNMTDRALATGDDWAVELVVVGDAVEVIVEAKEVKMGGDDWLLLDGDIMLDTRLPGELWTWRSSKVAVVGITIEDIEDIEDDDWAAAIKVLLTCSIDGGGVMTVPFTLPSPKKMPESRSGSWSW